MLKDETITLINYTKDLKPKTNIVVKRMRMKKKIKGNHFFYWMVKLKRKLTLTKEKTNQKSEGQIGKINAP
jgi:hypothetical protein